MIEYTLDTANSILYVRPESALEESDFVQLAEAADPYIEETGDLTALIIDAPRFPGWDSLGAMAAHFRFIRDHQKHIRKIGLVTDSAVGTVAEHLASYFVSAKIRHFPAGQLEAATQWAVNQMDFSDFATRYAAAWSGQKPEDLASFYSVDGSLTVNAGNPSIGRAAIAATAGEFMGAFPDMVVKMDTVSQEGDHVAFHWTWTGTNTGPGGTGKAVRISGYEEWTIDADGLIVESKGHYDEAEYQRQVGD